MVSYRKTVGIMGLSGNPAHSGHMEVALQALQLTGMDEVLFMVTPHSPFKDPLKYAPLEHRTHLANLAALSTGLLGTKIKVSDFEVLLRRFGVENSTVVMLEHFRDTYPALQPVWLMGADNLTHLHTWGSRWREIMELYPVGVFSRAGANDEAKASVAATQYAHSFLPKEEFVCAPGTWTFVDTIDNNASSSGIQASLARGEDPRGLCAEAITYIRQYNLYGCV